MPVIYAAQSIDYTVHVFAEIQQAHGNKPFINFNVPAYTASLRNLTAILKRTSHGADFSKD